ncbi:MAG: CsgG/HfaB family protein [Spirochaetota bacterium]
MMDIRVATIELVSRVPGESIDTAMLTEMFQVALVDRNAFNLMERALVDKILNEQEFQASGLSDSQIARIGAMAGPTRYLLLPCPNWAVSTS